MLHHPKFEEARRLLTIPETLENLAVESEEALSGTSILRQRASAATEALIEFLDSFEADPDLKALFRPHRTDTLGPHRRRPPASLHGSQNAGPAQPA